MDFGLKAGDSTISTDRKTSRGNNGRPRYLRWLLLFFGLTLFTAGAGTAGVIGAYYYVSPGLPAADTIREIPLQIPLRIFSRDGYLIEEVGERRRILVTYDEVPQHVVDAFVAAEDKRFWVHPGIDYQGILRALFLLVKTGEISGGGSTLTQQLARDYFLTREEVFTRKLREAFLAYKIEQEFSKQEIMALFLNKMFFGQRAYGVAAAAQVYFGKDLQNINEAEAATLAGVLPAPSRYNPVRSTTNASVRRGYVLDRMHDLDFIDDATYDAAMNYPMESQLHGTANELSASFVAEMVRQEMLDRYGEATYSNGYKVVTTLDSAMQRSANYALRNGLHEFSRRRGYRGPLATTDAASDVLSLPYSDWPEELRLEFASFNAPAAMEVAIVASIDDDVKTAQVVLQNGERETLEWFAMAWAKPYVDQETTGPAPEFVSDIMNPGDVIYVMPITLGGYALAQLPRAQSAVVSMDPDDGAITSLAGGYDFSLSKFNRVTQAIRQPGSSFKPFIYAAALNAGNTLATIVEDAPVVISSAALERLWRPINYSGRFYGEVRVRDALKRSMNLASVRLLLYNTTIGATVRFLEPFGFNDAALPRNGSLALGGGNLTPLDVAQGYSVFANGGYAVKPYVIDAIYDANDEVLYRAQPAVVCRECAADASRSPTPAFDPTAIAEKAVEGAPLEMENFLEPDLADMFPGIDLTQLPGAQLDALAESYRPDANAVPALFADVNVAPRIISEQIAYLIQDAMRTVIQGGTGIRAWRKLQRTDLSGKTGTSNDGRDAWFAGFNSNIVALTWVGYDDDTPLGPREEGSRTALPIWNVYMDEVITGTPLAAMPMPEGIVEVRIDKTTGCRANANTPDAMWEKFRTEYVPECEAANVQPDEIFNSFADPVELLEEDPVTEDEEDAEAEEEEPLF